MKYVCKRILMLLVTMVIVSLLAFAAFELIHGSAAEIMLGTQATPERVAELEAELGLDRPFLERYVSWLGDFVRGDMGSSYNYSIWSGWRAFSPGTWGFLTVIASRCGS